MGEPSRGVKWNIDNAGQGTIPTSEKSASFYPQSKLHHIGQAIMWGCIQKIRQRQPEPMSECIYNHSRARRMHSRRKSSRKTTTEQRFTSQPLPAPMMVFRCLTGCCFQGTSGITTCIPAFRLRGYLREHTQAEQPKHQNTSLFSERTHEDAFTGYSSLVWCFL